MSTNFSSFRISVLSVPFCRLPHHLVDCGLVQRCFFDTAVTHFKQGSRTGKVVAESIDEEKVAHAEPVGCASTDVSPAVLDNPSATDIFTWRHLEYTVPISGGQYRRLLDDIPGYV
jgi:ATP-binding cassette, subfamily G (WHITE), member 2, SNQ2